MNLFQCMFVNSPWYKETYSKSTPVGILWHDTAGGNPNLKRYVQPYETDENYDELISCLGKNTHDNDWNHSGRRSGVNAFIGKLADGTIATAQVGEWSMCPWGCGSGAKGSLNGYYRNNGKDTWIGKHYIQFEICDDGYETGTEEYFKAAYKEACEFTAYICEKYNIDPLGTVEFNDVTVPTIVCHKDANNLELGSAHGDVYVWFGKFGYDMNKVRADVKKIMDGETAISRPDVVDFAIGDIVRVDENCMNWSTGGKIAKWVYDKNMYVRALKDNDRVSISTTMEGAITGTVYTTDIFFVERPIVKEQSDNDINDQSTLVDSNDCPDEDELGTYIETVEEMQSFFVKLINAIINFIVNLFGDKK